jgi:hypothetical protein
MRSELESVDVLLGSLLHEKGRILMVQSNGNIPRFRRIFLALAFMLAVPVLIWLSNSYLTSLNKRSQAVETSVDAQTVADQQQTNLQAMNSQLSSRFYQIFASMNNSIQDPSLSSSGGLIAADITARVINFDQELTNYQSNFELATSPNMSNVRAYLESSRTGSKILSDQQSALNAIVNKDWPQYKMYQDKVLIELQAIANQAQNGIKVSSQLMKLWYEQDYNTLFITSQAFTQLKSDWQQIADIAASSSIAVSSVGISETLPIIITLLCISIVLLAFAIRWGIASFSMKAFPTRSGRLSKHRMYNVTKKEQDGQTTINLNTGVSSGNDTTGQEQQETTEQGDARAGIQRQRLVPFRSEQPFPESGHQTDQEEEIRRLKRELEITRQERDILKKTVSIFSQS